MKHFDYYKPGSLKEALDLMETTAGARFIAGSTDLMVKIRNRDVQPEALISLRSIPELSGIEAGAVTRIGAATTIAGIINHTGLREKFPLLVQAAARLGSAQIRNVATIGGNLCNCSPCADTAQALLVMEARVRLKSINGERELPIREFFLAPGETCAASNEILTDILIEPPAKNARVSFQKKGRVKMDLAIASVAALFEMEGRTCVRARLAAGSSAPVPLRLDKVEKLLEGKELTGELAAEARKAAFESVSPISDIRATEGYRRHIVGVYVKRAVQRAVEERQA